MSNHVQYGRHFKALVVYLRGYQLLPSTRTAELCQDIFKAAVSEGTLDTIVRKQGLQLQDALESVFSSSPLMPLALSKT